MTMNGRASLRPCLPQLGHHDLVCDSHCSSDCSTPSASAPASAIHSELSLAMSAAASAGTTSKVRLLGEMTPVAGPAMIITKATNTVARTQVVMPSVCGDRRANDAARSFSAAAWMARPVRDRRNQIARPLPSTTTRPISQRRSTATLAPPSLMLPVGRSVARGRPWVP